MIVSNKETYFVPFVQLNQSYLTCSSFCHIRTSLLTAMSVTPYSPFCRFDSEHKSTIICMSFSPSGRFLASGSEDASLVIWEVKKGSPFAKITLESSILCLLWDPRRPTALFLGLLDGSAIYLDRFQVSLFVT
jgi:WD40 repeat protein